MSRKTKQIIINLTIFLLIGGFVGYIITTFNRDEDYGMERNVPIDEPFNTPWQEIKSFTLPAEINRFELAGNNLYISAGTTIYTYDLQGNLQHQFPSGKEVRDITLHNGNIYILYPTHIEVYTPQGESIYEWEACSDLSDYCSFTFTDEHIFVTDAANKNICKYTHEGNFVTFIHSPRNFIIPSYHFAIENRNDTIYCVNSGRHQIEMYTPEGQFIASFGGPGGESGFFAGCCNPAYITFTPTGEIITSEKGNPRINTFKRNGKHKELWLTARHLGGGSKAYEIKAKDNNIYIAGKNKITIYENESEK